MNIEFRVSVHPADAQRIPENVKIFRLFQAESDARSFLESLLEDGALDSLPAQAYTVSLERLVEGTWILISSEVVC